LGQASETKRVLMIGSSTMGGAFGHFLELGLEAQGLRARRKGRVGSSLSRPDSFDWFAEAKDLVRSFRPDGAIVMFAGNDTAAISPLHGKRWIAFHQERLWSEEYRRRVNALVDILAPRGQPVVWVGAPIMRDPKLASRIQRANRIWSEEMARRPAASFIDTWSELTDNRGNYTRTLRVDGQTLLVRARDGMHLAKEGGRLLATRLLPTVHTRLAPDARGDDASDLSCLAAHRS
jgi:hypothetical protein